MVMVTPPGAATGGMPRWADPNVPQPYSAEMAQPQRVQSTGSAESGTGSVCPGAGSLWAG
jgi:hypothetical protein